MSRVGGIKLAMLHEYEHLLLAPVGCIDDNCGYIGCTEMHHDKYDAADSIAHTREI